MRRDWQARTDAVIEALRGERKRLLLQCCCGPCSSYVIEYLIKHFALTLLFYNPNIQPEAEYGRRLYWFRQVAERYAGRLALMDCAYHGEDFTAVSRGLEGEPEGGARCAGCFALRLRETARQAKAGGFSFFCTTLSVSPHKDAERINAVGLALEKEFGVTWLPSDFKKRGGFQRANALAREYGLYRQAYCGCLFSRAAPGGTRPGGSGGGAENGRRGEDEI
ncbi:MAG: epoxyqueuosine reductase QueH [Oscillospiraceae bacterium]|jgi:predicted adenine nucleotide alpha hydrolase (AANH) superfamily ATPase|nr:epoxyqueuosine reductase QueH [Oscillospiraceae bacterium]